MTLNATTRYLDRAARQCLNVSTVRAAYAQCSSPSQRSYMAILLRAVRGGCAGSFCDAPVTRGYNGLINQGSVSCSILVWVASANTGILGNPRSSNHGKTPERRGKTLLV